MIDLATLSDTKRLLPAKPLRGEVGPEGIASGAALGGDGFGPVRPRVAGARIPVTPEQIEILLHAATAPDLPLYNEPFTIRRSGPVDHIALRNAFNHLVRRHEILRTGFEMAGETFVQVVHDQPILNMPLLDLTGRSKEEREREAALFATEAAHRPFVLSEPPLIRAVLVRLAEDDSRVLVTGHHIVLDGVSIYGIAIPELIALYEAYATGRAPDLPPPNLQYGDFAVWRDGQTRSPTALPQMEYWRQELPNLPPTPQLPMARTRPAPATHRGAMEVFHLPADQVAALKSLGRREGATLYMVLLAALGALLYRYTGQEDLVIGGVADTRRRPELGGVVGYFLNSVPLRLRAAADLPFRSLLARAREAVFASLRAADVSFDGLVREVKPRREPGQHPLFQTMLVLGPPRPVLPAGWSVNQTDVTMDAAKFDLSLEFDEHPDVTVARILYSTDLFDAATIRRVACHFVTILETVVSDADRSLGSLPLLDMAEARQLLVEWNSTATPVPKQRLEDWVSAQAGQTPNAVAVEQAGQLWTYRDLERRAEVLAIRLRAAGVRRGDVVAIAMERRPEMVAGLLAILKAGAAYLPLDPAFPKSRLEMIAEDAAPVLLLSERALSGAVPSAGAPVLYCDVEDEHETLPFRTRRSDAMPSRATIRDWARDSDLAYVVYTSGSTGRPKGVEVPQRAIVNLLASMQGAPGFRVDDALLAVTTLSFDIAALEIFLPLVSGGRVILADRETATNPSLLAALLGSCGCTVMQATPATWRGLIEAGWSGLAGLSILCGGEALPRDLADKLLERCRVLWNVYGPTETTVWSTLDEVGPAKGVVPIGRPIANTSVYILDARGYPVPAGVPGDLYIGGSGLARGYRGRPDLTAERFVAPPAPLEEALRRAGAGRIPEISAGLDPRLYRTGDVARWRTDGTIECLGRSDNQVKIRGFRIELEEVEGVLSGHPGLAEAAVKAWRDASGEASLVAYVVGRKSAAMPATSDLRRFLGAILPPYMVPARFVPLDALPMTPNRKVDRNALPEPSVAERRAGEATAELEEANAEAAPRGATEERLAAMWRELLGLRSVGATENFFDLGGHSLLVAKLLRAIEAVFARRLTMANLFHAPTIRTLSVLLEGSASETVPQPRIIALQPYGSRPVLYWCDAGPFFRATAAAIGPDQPFLSVSLDFEDVNALPKGASLQEIAASVAAVIHAEQPLGPYFLGGWCKWGVLAFEVARQMRAAGDQIGLVVLLDATNPTHHRELSPLAIELSKARQHWCEIIRRRGRERYAYLLRRSRGALSRYGQKLGQRLGKMPRIEEPAYVGIVRSAVDRYDGLPYDGAVALIQPLELARILDCRQGWAAVVTGDLNVYDVPGDHVTMLQLPHAEALGSCIRTCVAEAQDQVSNQDQPARRRKAVG